MATFFGKKATAPAFSPVTSAVGSFVDSYSATANFTAADDIKLVRIPAGTEIATVHIQADDLDTNGTPTIVFRVGYTPCDSTSVLAANSTYFAAAGQTTAQAGGRLACSFKPITFQEDVYLWVTINTAAATFAAGDIHGIVMGACNGPK